MDVFIYISALVMLFVICPGSLYVLMEVIFDRTSHWSMAITGALAFNVCRLFIGLPYVYMAVLMALSITALELLSGVIFNRKHDIWDYRDKRWNYKGHVCLEFTVLWAVLMPPVILWYNSIVIMIVR